MFFVQCFISHIPFIGRFLLEYIDFDSLLSINLIEFNQNISKYLLVGSVGAYLGKIFFEVFSDLKIPYFYAMDNVGEINGGQNPAGPQGGQQGGQPGGQPGGQQGGQPGGPQGGGAPFNPRGGRYNVYDPTGMSNRGYIDPRTGHPYPTSQPFLGNILAVLQHESNVQGRTTVSLQNTG